MNAYLNTLTVKVLKEIAKQIGFRFISRMRKAELVELIAAEVEACHTEANREDKVRTRIASETPYTGKRTIAAIKAEGKISRMDYPVPYGRPVTEAHVKICNEYGCVTYVKNGMDTGICPRCGQISTSEEQITEDEIMTDSRTATPGEILTAYYRAHEENDNIDAAYAIKAEDIGMTIAQYLAHRKTHNGEIYLSGFWIAPIKDMTKVVVFDNGTRYGVTAGTASYYPGQIEDMPKGEIAECVHCRETVLIPATEETVSEEIDSDDITIDAFLAKVEAAIKPLAAFAEDAERIQWENDSDEAEQWTTVAKDLSEAMANVEWMLRYRANR